MSDWNNAKIDDDAEFSCAAGIWRLIGKRWTLLILKSMSRMNAIRFTETKKSLTGISSTMLSERLLELEREGLITRKIGTAAPRKVEYGLTDSAKELEVILKEIDRWHLRWNLQIGYASTLTNLSHAS